MAVRGNIAIGFFIATITSLDNMFSVMNDTIQRDVKSILQYYPEIENMIHFLTDSDNLIREKQVATETIELQNVFYRYPGQNVDALEDISLTIKKNEVIALVGENGSGKTTLSRVILGLLQPSEGQVLNRIKNAPVHNSSALFQEYQQYPLTLRDNIILSDINKNISDADIVKSCIFCGIDIHNKKIFPDGLDTILAKNFGGVELSGGQTQRVALARCIHRDAEMISLDEPTSAIDPIEESAFFKKIQYIAKDKTALVVTHRMGLISIVDRILVLDKGNIIEQGTHSELMKKRGKYFAMYTAQSKQYHNEAYDI